MPGVKVLLKGADKVIEFPSNIQKEQIEQILKSAENLPYIHSTQPNPYKKSQGKFAMDVEPAGQYITPVDEVPEGISDDFITGTKAFKKPLVIPFGEDSYEAAGNWKRVLSDSYGGKKGKALTKAIRKDGYDAIITVDNKGNLSESVDLYKGKGGVDMAAVGGAALGLSALSPEEASASESNMLTPYTNSELLSLDQLSKLPSSARPDVGGIQGPIDPEGLGSSIRDLGALLSKLELPLVGNPLEGVSEYMQNFGYNDSEKERLKRAAMAVLDLL